MYARTFIKGHLLGGGVAWMWVSSVDEKAARAWGEKKETVLMLMRLLLFFLLELLALRGMFPLKSPSSLSPRMNVT